MSHQQDRVGVPCPSCSPDLETVHEVLSTGGGRATVRCTECDHVHKTAIERERTKEVDVVVSQDGDSLAASTELPPGETLEAGGEFVVDTPEAIMQVRITALEVGPERREERAPAAEVETVWTRAVDNVRVPVTVHPGDGEGESRSVTVAVPGDEEFVVGDARSFGGADVEIEGIQLRSAVAEDYRFPKLDHEGDAAFAKDIKRLYARDRTSAAWSAW